MFSVKQAGLAYFRQLVRHALSVADERQSIESHQHAVQAEISRLKAEIHASMPKSLILSGFKAFSQVDEDGIIEALLGKLPSECLSRTAIEIGCGDGLENNTHFLLLKGFSAYWVDGSARNLLLLRQELGMTGERNGRLSVNERFITLDNISDIIMAACRFLGVEDPDFFSLDIDGNDLHILAKAIGLFKPKIVCVEYNGKFPPPTRLTIGYNQSHEWMGDDYHGASLQSFCDLLTDYVLVVCNISGTNAFFVRREFASGYTIYPVGALFQPLRTHLRFLSAGHPPSLKWLRASLEDQA